MVYVIQVSWQLCEQDQDGLSWSCSQAVSKPVWHIPPLLCVKWKTPDDGQRNCPKHVEFYSKNKFENLVHPVGFIIRIYQDARSPERQILQWGTWKIKHISNSLCRKHPDMRKKHMKCWKRVKHGTQEIKPYRLHTNFNKISAMQIERNCGNTTCHSNWIQWSLSSHTYSVLGNSLWTSSWNIYIYGEDL